ncbi:MAG: hypothetical protein F6K42_26885 [Leptolyngbya sp. SIO1D8]|nr:hypothetical protein [Leptolyngbya sp. SIO1D8]
MLDNEILLQVYLSEYEKLKEEQVARIGFRDNLLYVTLVLFGGILSFSLANKTTISSILVIPCVCIVLGWTYLANDEKITSIGQYIITELAARIEYLTKKNSSDSKVFQWEEFNRTRRGRERRKLAQLVVNESAFVLSGFVSIFIYFILESQISLFFLMVSVVEFLLLLVLGVEFIVFADLFDANSNS